MKSKDIIKALEEWIKELQDDYKRLQLLDAPMDCFEKSHVDNIRVLSNVLELIKSQQAEIEKLKKENAIIIKQAFAENRTTATAIKAEFEQQRRTVEYIKRLEAEIERLKAELDCYKKWYFKAVEDLKTAKTEAYKEFADRLDKHFVKKKNELPNEFIVNKFFELFKNSIQIVLKELTERKED